MSNKIPSLTDKAWSQTNELGTRTKILEYMTPDGMKQVEATGQMISGEEIDAIEDLCSEIDYEELDDEGNPKIEMDKTRYLKLRNCRIFGMEEDVYDNVMKNKSDTLRSEMFKFANELSGTNLSSDEIEKEKN